MSASVCLYVYVREMWIEYFCFRIKKNVEQTNIIFSATDSCVYVYTSIVQLFTIRQKAEKNRDKTTIRK